MAKKSKRYSTTFGVASMLAIILDEAKDNPNDPGEIRMEQARQLLSQWSSAQSSLMGAMREIINLKQGNCVRCEAPCDRCGRPVLREE